MEEAEERGLHREEEEEVCQRSSSSSSSCSWTALVAASLFCGLSDEA
jgi:hypothetical protein